MKKPQWILIGITGAFLFILLGMFVGRNFLGDSIRVNSSEQSLMQNSSTATEAPDGRIDINTATKQQLSILPGIGDTLAQRILDYRNEHGNFKTVDDLINVNGIGEGKLSQILPYIKVG